MWNFTLLIHQPLAYRFSFFAFEQDAHQGCFEYSSFEYKYEYEYSTHK